MNPILLYSLIFLTILIVHILMFRVHIYLITKRKKAVEKSTFKAISRVVQTLLETLNFEQTTKKVVNIILEELGYINEGYEVIVLSLLDTQKNNLKRIAISQTEIAQKFVQASPIPFSDIVIPLTEYNNLSVKAVHDKKMYVTENVADVLYPALSREWVEQFQKFVGVKTTIVFPIIARDEVLGTIIFSLSKDQKKISAQEWSILESFVGVVGVSLDNAQLFHYLNDTAQQLKTANDRLKEIDRLKDEFVSLASHELRTPMTIIKNYLWMLNHDSNLHLTDKQSEYLSRAYSSTDRLILLVNDMLNVSRIESGRFTVNFEEVDIKQLVKDIIFEMNPRAEELKISLTFNEPSHLNKKIKADPERIKQVLINLIGNSLKFTPQEGTITVTLQPQEIGVLVSVKDSGAGMTAEDISKLFQKFGTVGNAFLQKKNTQGTGLGLYITKSIVTLHNGKIWAESDGLDKGSTFYFTLPYVTQEEISETKGDKSATAAEAE